MLHKSKKKAVAIFIYLSLFMFLLIACEDNGLVSDSTATSDVENLDKFNSGKENGNYNLFINKLTEELDLTSDQVTQLEEFAMQQREEMYGSNQGNSGRRGNRGNVDQSLMMEKRKEMRAKLEEFLLTILTEKQIAKYEELKTSRANGDYYKEKVAEWLDELTTLLSLTDDQRTQIETVFQKIADKKSELKNTDYSWEEKKAMRESMVEEMKTEMALILTEEQQELFKQWFEENKGSKNRRGRGNRGSGFRGKP